LGYFNPPKVASGSELRRIWFCRLYVEAWGATGLEKMQYAFYRCAALESIPSPGPEAPFARVTTFSKAFDSCDALREIPADLFAG